MRTDELSGLLSAEGHGDLADAIPQIERYVKSWWQQNYQPWFTDHGPEHSREVAKYAFQLASSPSVEEDAQLEPLEYFILWASSWLHDLGMQSLLGIPLGTLQPSDYPRIRHEHPDQSAREVLKHAAAIGLPPMDMPLNQVVAFVARAHGTSYFEESIEYLRRIGLVRGQRVRAPLLASILLMADELHLDYQRNRTLPARAVNNHVSEAHALKHRVVVASEVCHQEDGEVGIRVTLQQNVGIEDRVMDQLQEWIKEKLLRQISMVENEFSKGFRMRVRLSKAIRFERQQNLIEIASPTPQVMSLIRRDNARSQLINHRVVLRDVVSHSRERKLVLVSGRLDGYQDVDGREDVLSVVSAELEFDGATVRSSIGLRESYGAATCLDVLRQLTGNGTVEGADAENRTVALNALCASISQDPSQTAILISSIDALSRGDCEWMVGTAIRRLMALGDVSVVLTCQPDMEADATVASEVVRISTEEVDYDDVGRFLARYSSWRSARDASQARWTYAGYKSLASKNKQGIEEDAWYDH